MTKQIMIDFKDIDLNLPTKELLELTHKIMDERFALVRDFNRPDLQGEERRKHEVKNIAREEFLAYQLKVINAEIDVRLAKQRMELKEAEK